MSAKKAAKAAKARILIVDDEPDGATSLGKLLELIGCAVCVETDPTRCLPQLEAFGPGVILLDIAMPGLSGYELARQIRATPRGKRVTILAMSGYADQKHQQAAIEAGCDGHFAKPLDVVDLEATIAAHVQPPAGQPHFPHPSRKPSQGPSPFA